TWARPRARSRATRASDAVDRKRRTISLRSGAAERCRTLRTRSRAAKGSAADRHAGNRWLRRSPRRSIRAATIGEKRKRKQEEVREGGGGDAREHGCCACR